MTAQSIVISGIPLVLRHQKILRIDAFNLFWTLGNIMLRLPDTVDVNLFRLWIGIHVISAYSIVLVHVPRENEVRSKPREPVVKDISARFRFLPALIWSLSTWGTSTLEMSYSWKEKSNKCLHWYVLSVGNCISSLILSKNCSTNIWMRGSRASHINNRYEKMTMSVKLEWNSWVLHVGDSWWNQLK